MFKPLTQRNFALCIKFNCFFPYILRVLSPLTSFIPLLITPPPLSPICPSLYPHSTMSFGPQTTSVNLFNVTSGTDLFNSVLPSATTTQASSRPPFGGLFNLNNTTSSTQQGSVFGTSGTGAQQPSGGSNPFGSATSVGTSQPGTTGSLFGTGMNPSGGLGSSQPPRTTSIFGAAQPVTTSGASGVGVFGSQTTQVGLGGNSFAAPLGGNQAATSAPTRSSLFGTSLPRPLEQHGQGREQNAYHSAYFNSLLERNKKRTHRDDEPSGFGDVPSLQLGLGDISKRVRELGGAGTPNRRDRATDSRA